MSVACIRGKCSSYHVDANNGLTFTACSNDGLAAAKLAYADGGQRNLGRFWTEILPRCMHRVVAVAERTALSVYLSPLVAYRAREARANGPTQIVLRRNDGKGETQHSWPNTASASNHNTEWQADIGVGEIVPAGSKVFVQLDSTTPSFSLTAGGKIESWSEVSGEGNLCFWRCLSAILKLTRHPDQGKSVLSLKQEVCDWGIMHATKVSQQLECPPNTLLNDIRTVQRRGVMANEKCFALAALYFDLKLLIVDEDSAICWGLLPLQQGEDDMRLWSLWRKDQHFWHGTRTVDCTNCPAMDALLGTDGEEAAVNKMQLWAGGKPSWMCAALTLMVPYAQVTGDWTRTIETARREEKNKHWKLATINSTCWNSMCMQLAEWGADGPDIICQQERHQRSEQETTMQSDARMKGYKAFVSPVFSTGRGGTSGGTAIMIRRRYGAVAVAGPPGLTGRLTAIRIAGIAKAPPLLVLLYLPVDATVPELLQLAEPIGDGLQQQEPPLLLAGDFNKRPELMDGRAIDRLWQGRFVCAHGPTCGDSEIDFFCLHSTLLPRVKTILASDDTVVRPHVPVMMELVGQGKFNRMLQKVAVPRLPHTPLVGPLKEWRHPEVNFSSKTDCCRHHGELATMGKEHPGIHTRILARHGQAHKGEPQKR
eukprot:4650574-Amphidinium_carterae.2